MSNKVFPWHPTVYCRREPTTDSVALAHVPAAQLKRPQYRDWVFYHDADCTRLYCRTPWYHNKSGPRRSRKTVTLNCLTYRLVWVN